MDAFVIKSPSGALLPATGDDAEKISQLKIGELYEIEIIKRQNPLFRRRWFKLLHYAYDVWTETREPIIYNGEVIHPNFERFRKDITILAGFYVRTFNILGEPRLEAMSTAPGNMNAEQFEKLYDASIMVILNKVMNNTKLTPEMLKLTISNIMSYDK